MDFNKITLADLVSGYISAPTKTEVWKVMNQGTEVERKNLWERVEIAGGYDALDD